MKLYNRNGLLIFLVSLLGICVAVGFFPIGARLHHKAGLSGDLSELDVQLAKYFKLDSSVFERKRKPEPSDWLANYEERGQTYGQYLADGANIPSATRNVLYVLPLGEFTKDAPSIKELEIYMKSYYTPLQVKILNPVKREDVRAKSRLNGGVTQWKTGDILNWMKGRLPNDAFAMLAVTMTDLYPDEEWNFVFGQASYQSRVGVFSFARYSSEEPKIALLRATKILSHDGAYVWH